MAPPKWSIPPVRDTQFAVQHNDASHNAASNSAAINQGNFGDRVTRVAEKQLKNVASNHLVIATPDNGDLSSAMKTVVNSSKKRRLTDVSTGSASSGDSGQVRGINSRDGRKLTGRTALPLSSQLNDFELNEIERLLRPSPGYVRVQSNDFELIALEEMTRPSPGYVRVQSGDFEQPGIEEMTRPTWENDRDRSNAKSSSSSPPVVYENLNGEASIDDMEAAWDALPEQPVKPEERGRWGDFLTDGGVWEQKTSSSGPEVASLPVEPRDARSSLDFIRGDSVSAAVGIHSDEALLARVHGDIDLQIQTPVSLPPKSRLSRLRDVLEGFVAAIKIRASAPLSGFLSLFGLRSDDATETDLSANYDSKRSDDRVSFGLSIDNKNDAVYGVETTQA